MSIVQIVVVVAVVGFFLWLVNALVPMEARIKQILNAAVIIAVAIWLVVALLRAFGIA